MAAAQKLFLNRFGMTGKISAVVLFLIMLNVVVVGLMLHSYHETTRTYDNLVRVRMEAASTAEGIASTFNDLNSIALNYQLTPSVIDMDNLTEQFRQRTEKIRLSLIELQALAPEHSPVIQTATQALDKMAASFERMRKLRVDQEAGVVFDEWDINGEKFKKIASTSISETSQKLRKSSSDTADALSTQVKNTTMLAVFGTSIVLLLGAIGSMMFVVAYISRPLRAMAVRIRQLLDVSGETQVGQMRGDEIGHIRHSLDTALTEIRGQSLQIASAVSEATSAVGQVSEGARAQMNALSQVGAALGETASAIRQVSEGARKANEHAQKTASSVAEGQESVDRLVHVVRGISQNSLKVSQITQVIAQIADRTHILSLNAAIEAARAGEHGKGFVVVAQEVGKLAESAAQNAKQIDDIVANAVREAVEGESATELVRNMMASVAERTTETTTLIQSVSVSMEQQQATVTQIDGNVAELRNIAASNSAASEEITATMRHLSELARNTSEVLGRYELSETR